MGFFASCVALDLFRFGVIAAVVSGVFVYSARVFVFPVRLGPCL